MVNLLKPDLKFLEKWLMLDYRVKFKAELSC